MTNHDALDITRRMIENYRESARYARMYGTREDEPPAEDYAAIHDEQADALEQLVKIVSQISE